MVNYLKKIRNNFLKRTIWRKYKIGRRFHAGARVRLWAKDRLEIGDDFYIGRDSFIETNCVIGNYVIVGNKVAIVGRYDHHYQEVGTPIRIATSIRDDEYRWKGKNLITRIGDDVWIGYGSTILQGVTICSGAIIAAGSIVTKDVAEYSIVAGNPAKKIRDRFETESDLLLHKTKLKEKYMSNKS